MTRRLVITAYDSAWPAAFAAIEAILWRPLAGLALAIEHVGSTAVPGLPAKPIIDIDVVVPDDEIRTGIDRLARIGYRHRGDLGIPTREAFWSPEGGAEHHLYLCPESSPALANHLAVRDFLRREPHLAEEYGALKRRLARDFPQDRSRYVAGKTAFIVEILRKQGFTEESLTEVEALNA